jgi:hypothetical protein
MKKNMGNVDKIVRLAIAALVIILFSTNVLSGTIGIVLVALSAVFVMTSLIGFCPLYKIVGLSTCSVEKK